jgi:hypothetical protein
VVEHENSGRRPAVPDPLPPALLAPDRVQPVEVFLRHLAAVGDLPGADMNPGEDGCVLHGGRPDDHGR